MRELSDRVQQSKIPSPVSRFGVYVSRPEYVEIAYDGRHLTAFLAEHGGNPVDLRRFLELNSIGNVFDDLVQGLAVVVPKK